MADKKSKETEYVVESAIAKARYDFTSLNTLAVVSLATSVSGFGGIAGVITGHFSLAQIKKSGERGRGLAIAGLVIGYGYIALGLLMSLGGALLRLRGIEMGNGHQFGAGTQGGWGMMGGNGHDDDNGGWVMMGGQSQMNGGHGQIDGGQGQLPGQPTAVPMPMPQTRTN